MVPAGNVKPFLGLLCTSDAPNFNNQFGFLCRVFRADFMLYSPLRPNGRAKPPSSRFLLDLGVKAKPYVAPRPHSSIFLKPIPVFSV